MSLLPQLPTINTWLKDASQQLAVNSIPSARLDAELLLAHTLRKSRTFLHAHGNEALTHRQYDIANARLQLRIEHTPLAYIIGHKEFYGRLFKVTPATLIPRPESEDFIELMRDHPSGRSNPRCIDVGTGSGCLGITLKLEFPELDVTAIDVSRHALKVAEENARHYTAEITFLQSNLLEKIYEPADIIVANLPYVDKEWELKPELYHEPGLALFAEKHGLALIISLLEQIKTRSLLSPSGKVLLEADLRQHDDLIRHAASLGFSLIASRGLILCLSQN